MRNIHIAKLFFILFISVTLISFRTSKPKDALYVLVGTYTKTDSKGIYLYRMDPETGTLSFVSNSPFTQNPSYAVIHPNGKWVYATNENGEGEVSAFSINRSTNEFLHINSVSAKGNSPCFISLDNTGKFAFTANYGTGNVAVYPIKQDGSLGEALDTHQHTGKGVTKRQEGPHAHQILPGLDNYVYSNDLGTDKIYLYKFDPSKGKLALQKEIATQPGAGPRHLTFHQNQKWVYVVNELNGTIEAFYLNKTSGDLNRFQIISTLPEDQKSAFAGCADIHITPSGKFLYATNRAEINSIAMYSIGSDGKLTLLGHQSTKGKSPRNFAIDPSGKFLLVANQNTGNIVTFRIEPDGKLTDTGIETKIPMPVCLQFFK